MPNECPECGFHVDPSDTNCPKCDFEIRKKLSSELFVIDVAHSGEDWYTAQEKVDWALDRAFFNSHKGLKVIHGHGEDVGHTSVIKAKAVRYLKALEKKHEAKLVQDKHNSGAHIIYF